MKKLPFLTAAAIAFGLGTSAITHATSQNNSHNCHHQGNMIEQHSAASNHQHHRPASRLFEARKKQLEDREFTHDELEILVNARLIKLGNDNLRLGQIDTDKDGNYRVDIVTQDGSLALRRILGKNSLPVSIDGKTKAFGMGLHTLAPAKGQRSEITETQARTLVEARLLMVNNPYLKVGNIKEKNKGYIVKITTRDGSAVTERFISKDGLRKRMNKMHKREQGGFRGYSHKNQEQVEYNG